MTEALFPMLVVEKLTGLTRRQIRYYETKGLLKPGRTGGGHRLYSPQEVELLLRVQECREQGFYSLCEVKRFLKTGGRPQASERAPAPRRQENDASTYFDRVRLVNPK